ncbi:putative fibroblast growth factor 1 isoform X2 [Pungitius pungitius]|uniref:putative fibroblast growth factor 1 isoform X2 n=1 Tax=Pungitius pungitius TaxID=134920 RepID=UPI002E13D436
MEAVSCLYRSITVREPADIPPETVPLIHTAVRDEMFASGDQTVIGGPLGDFRQLTRLYCRNGGHHLQIAADGAVQGQRDEGDVHTVLKLKAVDKGVVVIQGTQAGRYLAMSDEGRLYSSPIVTDECYFLEKLEENHYNTYASQKYQERNWYVALKKNGRPKLGPRTHIGQKAVFFLPRRLGDAAEWKQMGHQEIV